MWPLASFYYKQPEHHLFLIPDLYISHKSPLVGMSARGDPLLDTDRVEYGQLCPAWNLKLFSLFAPCGLRSATLLVLSLDFLIPVFDFVHSTSLYV